MPRLRLDPFSPSGVSILDERPSQVVRQQSNGYIGEVKISGLLTAGTNVTLTGDGTKQSPYNIASSGGGATSPLTTKGDVYTYDTASARLPVGGDGTVLSSDSSATTGLKWIAAGGTGTVTTVSSATADATVANPTTAPAITIVSAPKLTTARAINGVNFDGTAAITVADSTKVPTTTTVNGHALSSNVTVTATDLSLGNVDNTSDASKPVSTAQQTALNLKANLASPTFTGTVTVPTPSNGTDAATKTYVDGILAGADAVLYKGAIDASANPNYPAADAGFLYVISVAGKIGGASGTTVETGDLIICKTDGTSAGTQAGVGSAWDVIQTNLVNAALRSDKLSAFAATTSSELAGVISDETGTGALVFGTSPALTTPTGIVKGDVGLGNVDNTSDATKNSASVTLANKTLTSPVLNSPTSNTLLTANTEIDLVGASGTLHLTAASDGGDYNIYSSNGAQALAVYGSGANTLNFNLLDGVFQTASTTRMLSNGTLNNTTFDTAGTGNSFSINGTAVTAVTGTGANVLASTPTITTPVLNGTPTGTGVATASTASTLALRDASGNLAAVNLLDGYSTTVTAAGTTTLTVASNNEQFFTGSTTQIVLLPVASTLSLGLQYVITNNSTGAVTVQSSGANAILILAGGTAAMFTCILTSGTTAASWSATYLADSVATGKKLTVSQSLTLAGTDSTTMTFPSTSATIARTDAANTFTGHQTIEGITTTGATGAGKLVFDGTPTLVTPVLGVATATTINKVTVTAPASAATLTIPDGVTLTGPATSGTAMTLGNAETVTGVKTFGAAGNVGKLLVAGTTSGTTILNATAVASGTLTLPAATDTLVGKATTDTLTNKTINASQLVNASVIPDKLATGAAKAVVATSEATTSTTYVDLTTTSDTVTVTIGANGLALVVIDSTASGTISGADAYMSFAVSGASTVAASDANAYVTGAVSGLTAGQSSRTVLMTGLTAGSTTFKAKYRTTSGNPAFSNRNIAVIPL